MEDDNINREYGYSSSAPTWSNHYLWPILERVIDGLSLPEKRVFELGCGNGATGNFLASKGFEVTGVDPSKSGITVGRRDFPHLNLHEGSAYSDLASMYGTFPFVVSLEVIEHCFDLRKFAATFKSLLGRRPHQVFLGKNL